MPGEVVLRMRGITKRFPGTLALDGVDFDLREGEVHVLLGENGAGKSTLMKILSGAYSKDAGEIELFGRKVEIQGPAHARSLGIAVIYQELNLIPHLSVAENIFLGREPRGALGLIDWSRMREEARRWLEEVGAKVDPSCRVKGMSVGHQQLVEIAKALSTGARILVMDEPTSALSPAEVEELFKVIRKLKGQGRSIVFISHHLEEVKEIGDRVTVLRDGRLVGTVEARTSTVDDFIRMMVGRNLEDKFPKAKVEIGEEVLRVENLTRRGVVEGVSFSLRKGEILGVAGLVGAGRTEMCRALFGADPKDEGRIFVEGREVEIRCPADAIRAGMGFLTENRKEEGLVLSMSVKENITLPFVGRLRGYLPGLIGSELEDQVARKFFEDLRIKAPSLKKRVKELSGGNQQKVVLAKWLATRSKVLIFDEPTRGIDVGAKVEIYQLMNELARQGVGILMVSSELPEVLAMSDRIMVMADGRVTAILDRAEATEELIMRYATAVRRPFVCPA